MKILDQLAFAINFSRGQNALFDQKYDVAMKHLRKAVALGGSVNLGLWGEAKIYAAICAFREGDTAMTLSLYTDGLRNMSDAGSYSADDLRYVSKYMDALVHQNRLVEEPINIENVRRSFRRDFPMSIETLQ